MFINKKKLYNFGRNQLGKWAMFSPQPSNRKVVKHFIMLIRKEREEDRKRKGRNFWPLKKHYWKLYVFKPIMWHSLLPKAYFSRVLDGVMLSLPLGML